MLALSQPFVDHCRFSFRQPVEHVLQRIGDWVASHWAESESWCDSDVTVTVTDAGRGNFSEVLLVRWRGLLVFKVRRAGESTRGWSDCTIDGSGCAMLRSAAWPELSEVGERLGWRLARVDVAVDDDRGVLTRVEDFEALYDQGLFDSPAGGRRREFDPRDPRRGHKATGWTVNVGERTGALYWRSYLKQAEVIARRGAAAAASVPPQRVRHELELKRAKGTLEWAVLRDLGGVLASHSAFAAALTGGEASRRSFRVARDRAEAELMSKLAFCRHAYGTVLMQAYHAFGGDDAAWLGLRPLICRTDGVGVRGVCEVVGGAAADRDYVHDELSRE